MVMVVWMCMALAGAQAPAAADVTLANDPELQAALQAARGSRWPHREILAERIAALVENDPADRQDFKAGALAVLEHATATDIRTIQLYAYILQQHVVAEVLRNFHTAAGLQIDGETRDWPRHEWLEVPVVDKRNPPPLRAFAALRDEQALYVAFATHDKPEGSAAKRVYGVEVRQLETFYTTTDYRLELTGSGLKIYDAALQELPLPADHGVVSESGARTIESRIPLIHLGPDIRSIAVRSFILDPGQGQVLVVTPWIALPTGPVDEPLTALLHIASQRPLTTGNVLPLAVALQEGLLLRRCAAEVRPRVLADAVKWLEFAESIDGRLELSGLTPLSKLPLPALLTWAGRYDGSAYLADEEAYEFHVPLPDTISAVRDHATRRGWFGEGGAAPLLKSVASEVRRFDHFDWPDAAARATGAAYADPRADAYIESDDTRLLSYRDIGINRRWRLHFMTRGLKGSFEQRQAFARMLAQATGLPTLSARHRNAHQDLRYPLSFDGREWLAPEGTTVDTTQRDEVFFSIGLPWSRPERFDASAIDPAGAPSGSARWILDARIESLQPKRLNAMLEKGIDGAKLGGGLLPALP